MQDRFFREAMNWDKQNFKQQERNRDIKKGFTEVDESIGNSRCLQGLFPCNQAQD